MMTKQKIKVDIISDVVCPWCYIGKRRLEKAIIKLSDRFDFELEYHPFELNPNMPQNGLSQKEYLSNKFGGDERYDQITDNTTDVAVKEGLVFDFANQEISPNTRNLHAIIQLAKEENKQLEVVEAFFQAYFAKGINLSQHENIIKIGTTAGIPREKIVACLHDDDAKLQIEIAESEISKLGISGVPFYIINNRYGISGAQSPETFIEAFEEIGSAVAVSHDACNVENKDC